MSGERLTVESILVILQERGFRCYLDSRGVPHVLGPVAAYTPALAKVLAIHRVKIIERLKQQKAA